MTIFTVNVLVSGSRSILFSRSPDSCTFAPYARLKARPATLLFQWPLTRLLERSSLLPTLLTGRAQHEFGFVLTHSRFVKVGAKLTRTYFARVSRVN